VQRGGVTEDWLRVQMRETHTEARYGERTNHVQAAREATARNVTASFVRTCYLGWSTSAWSLLVYSGLADRAI
jgi:hypothetical protein